MSCFPKDVSQDQVPPESCPNLAPIGDAGVPDVDWPWDLGVPADVPMGHFDGGV
ncbi:MAG: hypothetical protein JRH20_25185 [Deltaproteobacteria bacterium]|nr:hypothetical protein [Deltaproteobacteria bacterium]